VSGYDKTVVRVANRGPRHNGRRNRFFNIPGARFVDRFARFIPGTGFFDVQCARFFNRFEDSGFFDIQDARFFNRFARFVDVLGAR
jgi:hypothetical protein